MIVTTHNIAKVLRDMPDLIPPRRLNPSSAAGYATDYCFVGRVKVIIPENTNGYEFLQINLGESPSAVWVAALPDIQPENAVVFQITGRPRIYLSGEFA